MPTSEEFFACWQKPPTKPVIQTIRESFLIPEDDGYVYRAEAFTMTLSEIQQLLDTNNMQYQYYIHGKPIEANADIIAYTTLLLPSTTTSKALTGFVANAKKGSPREKVAQYLLSKRLVPQNISIPRSKTHKNPYYDIWAASCRLTSFLGPLPDPGYADPAAAKATHPLLPVLYHHFGCVCPSYEALWVIDSLAKGKGVVEIGSGNGYWAYMLRRMGTKTTAVDSTASSYRYTWIDDTKVIDGQIYLRNNGGGSGKVLMLVYPVTQSLFTKNILKAFKGDTIVIVGTQNANRYTGFSDCTAEEYFQREKKDWELTWRIALPSFAGKDDALFVWQKKN